VEELQEEAEEEEGPGWGSPDDAAGGNSRAPPVIGFLWI